MKIDFFSVDQLHHWGDNATHPIELSGTRLGALLLLEGRTMDTEQTLEMTAKLPPALKQMRSTA